jgi:hypothetical protein
MLTATFLRSKNSTPPRSEPGLEQSETLRSAEPQRLKGAGLEPWTSP